MMSLMEQYNAIFRKLIGIQEKVKAAELAIHNITSNVEGDIPTRIANLEDQLKKIDEYTLKIEAFRTLAEKNLDSQNILTIEAPPGYRVNLNRLRSWSMMIDPMSSNDPYAQRVYVVAKCDLCFLEQKRQEFVDRIAMLKSDEKIGLNTEVENLEKQISAYKDEIQQFASSEEIATFAISIENANKNYWFEHAPEIFISSKSDLSSIAPGAYVFPFAFAEEQKPLLKSLFGKFYDADGGNVLLPAEINTDKEFAMAVVCTPSRSKQLNKGIQNLILNTINNYPEGINKVYILDAMHFNSSVLGSLKQIENSFAINQIPRNPEQLSAVLEQIVSSFADKDDLMESSESFIADSVIEYNETCDPTKKISRMMIIIVGGINSFESRDREYIHRIMTNYERYGISFINISYGETSRAKQITEGFPEYAAYSAIQINMQPKETTIRLGSSGAVQKFTWYVLNNALTESYIQAVKEVKIQKYSLGDEYPTRHDLLSVPQYERKYKSLSLPYGIDAKDNEHSISFEDENFAAYLVGASGSGKSTLLHILISGVIRNYHPDNVELWLADFKQLEFKNYMQHRPPHIKYVLLDESIELVYDLIDRINSIMMERQRIFGKLGINKLKDIDPNKITEPMPLIFIILDEFSVMSQAISESQVYKLRLQNVLAKGRALGIRFLFASQTFTTGVVGLTPTAKAQIQQRITMKGSRDEIAETLELSANLKTEQVNNWMDALPPYYALTKHRNGPDAPPEVNRVKVLYFPRPDEYEPLYKMIDSINANMTKVQEYKPNNNINTYVDKAPVMVDGNTYDAFNIDALIAYIKDKKTTSADVSEDDVFVSFGTPRLMSPIKAAVLSPETRENILLVGRDSERKCTASIITSAMKSFAAQGKSVSVWAYGKNKIYKDHCGNPWGTDSLSDVKFVEGISDICDVIRDLKKKIKEKQASNELIVLVGMDRICSDFEFIDAISGESATSSFAEREKARQNELVARGAIITSRDEEEFDNIKIKIHDIKGEIQRKGQSSGKAQPEIDKEIKKATAKLMEQGLALKSKIDSAKDNPIIDTTETNTVSVVEEKEVKGEYNASEDFKYVVRQGSRLGYHFFMHLNSLDDIKQTNLKVDLFRHRLAFQVSDDDSRELFGSRMASSLPEHICQYFDTLERFSLRPYLHKEITWDDWAVDDDGYAVNPLDI